MARRFHRGMQANSAGEEITLPPRELLRFLWSAVQPVRGFLWQAGAMIWLMAIVNLPLPLLNQVGIDALIPSGAAWPLLALGALAFFVRGVASAFQVFQNYVVHRVMAGLAHDLRSRMVQALLRTDYSRFVSGEVAGLVGRLTADVPQVERMVYDTISFVIRPWCMILVMGIAMLALDWRLTLVLGVLSPLCIFIWIRLENNLDQLEEDVLKRRQSLQADSADCFDNIRAIRCFGREERFSTRMRSAVAAFAQAAVGLSTRRQLLQAGIEFALIIPWLGVVAVGVPLAQQGVITLGELMAFVVFEELLRSPVAQFTWYCTQTRAMLVSARRVQEVCALPAETAGSRPAPTLSGAISLRGLRFAYGEGAPVIAGLDLDIQAGERVAIVGASGGGKTTLFNLLLGFYQPSEGQICYDDQDLRHLDPRSVRSQIGCVFQDNPLFDGSIRDNLRLHDDYSDEALWQALTAAEAEDFVREQPLGLDTIVGTRGLKLSGGQRQRLAIARVALRPVRIILLDEATSSLDSVTEEHIRHALERLLSGRTSLTIAHRLSTVVAADRILYLEHGHIVESGRHQDLVRQGGRYAALYHSQVDGLLPG